MTDTITAWDDIEAMTLEKGFLPFFKNQIPGFSVEEHTPPELWFSKDKDGPWEWKGPVARSGECLYGKLFRGKAGFVSLEWLPDLANYRRDGYDFDSRYEDGIAPAKDKQVYDVLLRAGDMLSTSLKAASGYGQDGMTGFDAIINRLQMQTYISIKDFEYMTDKKGRQFGWGVARYTTPEVQFGPEAVTSAYSRQPMESYQRIIRHLEGVLPGTDRKTIEKLIK